MNRPGLASLWPGALKADIRAVERRLENRRGAIADTLGSLAGKVRSRMLSPATIIGAGLFGVALHRSHRLRGLKLLAALQTLNAGLRLLFTGGSLAKVAQAASE